MMEEKDDNKFIIEQGLGLLFNTPRPGLKALIALCDIPELNQRQVAQKIVTLLNITALRNHHPDSYVLLSSSSPEQSKALAEKLLQESRDRQELISAITAEISESLINSNSAFIFEGSPEWPQVLTGAVASRLCNKQQKPTFIFKLGPKLSRGSLRTPKGIDGVEALKACHNFLETYGGHTQAAGFCFLSGNLEQLKNCLDDYFKNFS
jgi:single-stranded-DNA-specific exonuclease